MRAFISISSLLLLITASGYAETGFEDFSEKTSGNEESDDFLETPYTQYGEFNEDEDEAATTDFFQHGRFFGVSLGFGFHGTTGNRALLWEGGFPMVDFRVHYWFDFNFALQLQFFTANHNYFANSSATEVSLNHYGVWLKYYFDTRNLSAPVTFAHPYIAVGGGSFTKTETEQRNQQDPDRDSIFGFGLGAGLEFMITHKKVYFDVQGQIRSINFLDRLTTDFRSEGIEDLSGLFYSITGSILFTW